MKKLTVLTLLLFSCSVLFAQTMGVKWSRPIGGTSLDEGKDVAKTTDGGFLFAGQTILHKG